jgi:hypothetical protein
MSDLSLVRPLPELPSHRVLLVSREHSEKNDFLYIYPMLLRIHDPARQKLLLPSVIGNSMGWRTWRSNTAAIYPP